MSPSTSDDRQVTTTDRPVMNGRELTDSEIRVMEEIAADAIEAVYRDLSERIEAGEFSR